MNGGARAAEQSVEQLCRRLARMVNSFLEDPPTEGLSEAACLQIATALVHQHFSEVTWVAEQLELLKPVRWSAEQEPITEEGSGDA